MFQTRGHTWVFLLLVLAGPALADARELSGRYVGEGLGAVELSSRDGRVVARYVAGGSCPFQPEQEVLTGTFEGNVLVGTLALCQRGVACQDRTYSVLAFFHPDDRSLVARVKLESGCSSPALQGTLLRLAPAPVEGGTPVAGEPRRPLDAGTRQKLERALRRGQDAFDRSRFDEAAGFFEEALRYDPGFWAAHFGLGVAEFKRGNTAAAIREYERVRVLEPGLADTYYNLACAHARLKDRAQALAFLQQAVERGFDQAEVMAHDADLGGLFREDLEFQRLLEQVKGNGRTPARGGR